MDDTTTPDDPNEIARRGGFARAEKMTPEERAASASKASRARWLRATHAGEIDLLGLTVPCFVLEDGRRVLSNGGMMASLHMKRGGQGKTSLGGDRLARFSRGQRVSRYISDELAAAVENPIKFRVPAESGFEASGYEAWVLADLCEAVLRARDDGALMKQQMHIAQRCDLLMRGFARVGLVALIDEATGYQYDRARDALAEILEIFVAKELARWVKSFPDDYYQQLFRLLNWKYDSVTNKKPPVVGHFTNDIVYRRLAPGVLDELKRKNPVTESGRRRHKHHQWLTRDHGHPALREHLVKVVTLMQVSKDYKQFTDRLDQVAPRVGDTIPMPFLGLDDDGSWPSA